MAVTKLGPTGTPRPAGLGTASPLPPEARVTTVSLETAWQGSPDAHVTQILHEATWSGIPDALATQILVELIHPFECPTFVPSCPPPPIACPTPEAVLTGANAASGCPSPETPVPTIPAEGCPTPEVDCPTR